MGWFDFLFGPTVRTIRYPDNDWITTTNVNGRLEGLYEQGHGAHLLIRTDYKDDRPHGLFRSFSGNERLHELFAYENGYLNGLYQIWNDGSNDSYDQANQVVQGTYRRNRRHGPWKEWDDDGNLIFDGIYDKGRLVSQSNFVQTGRPVLSNARVCNRNFCDLPHSAKLRMTINEVDECIVCKDPLHELDKKDVFIHICGTLYHQECAKKLAKCAACQN